MFILIDVVVKWLGVTDIFGGSTNDKELSLLKVLS